MLVLFAVLKLHQLVRGHSLFLEAFDDLLGLEWRESLDDEFFVLCAVLGVSVVFQSARGHESLCAFLALVQILLLLLVCILFLLLCYFVLYLLLFCFFPLVVCFLRLSPAAGVLVFFLELFVAPLVSHCPQAG